MKYFCFDAGVKSVFSQDATATRAAGAALAMRPPRANARLELDTVRREA
jgi:hypothetical protein